MRSSRAALNAVKRAMQPVRNRHFIRQGSYNISSLARRMGDIKNFRDLADPIRHLTYHIYPTLHAEESWQWNLRQLAQRISLFNGKKILGINTGPETTTVDMVLEYSQSVGIHWDHVIERPNNPGLGEVITWVPSLEILDPENAKPNEVVFSAHAKGVKYGACPPIIRRWTECLYRGNLDSWFLIREQLEWFVSTGIFRGRWAGATAFSGGFFWWRLHDIGQRNWRKVTQFYAGREVWIGSVAESDEIGCVFHDRCRDLYIEGYWQHHVDPAWVIFEKKLIPDRNRTRKPLAYLISSHFSYAPLALPRLLDSLIACGVSPDQIFVVMCGCRREFDQKTSKGTFWYVNHESRNFCTFVEAVSHRRREALSKFDHMFLLLDTSDVGPKFKELTEDFNREYDAVGVNPHGGEQRAQCDLAAYSFDYLLTMRQQIEKFRDAHWRVNWDWEGRIFGEADRKTFYGRRFWGPLPTDKSRFEHIGKQVIAGPENVYGTGTARITEYYKYADLYRFKSNWGQNPYLLDSI